MKKLFLVLIAIAIVSVGAFAQSSRNLSVSVTYPEILNLTLGATTVDLGNAPAEFATVWSSNITASAVISITSGNVAVQISQTAQLTSGTNQAGFLYTRGLADFMHTESQLSSTPTQKVLWTAPGETTKSGSVAVGYRNDPPRPAGTYTATVVYTLVKI